MPSRSTPFSPRFFSPSRLTRTSPLALVATSVLLVGCLAPPASGNAAPESASKSTTASTSTGAVTTTSDDHAIPDGASVATFASGCFWCVESIYESVKGVHEAVSGYAGGERKNPTYEQVSRGATKHAEAVQVYYDPTEVNYGELIDVFFASQNPTQVNGQGPDRGPQYRSAIYYATDEEKMIAEKKKAELEASGMYDRPIAAEITKLDTFWKAEEYHQDYEHKNPSNPYVRGVSVPRLKRFQAKKPELLKSADGH